MMEMKTVLSVLLRLANLTAPDRRPESPRTRHVTQVRGGGRVVAVAR
jgi:hypothetical protein